MGLEDSTLYNLVDGKLQEFKAQARKHKVLHRTSWWATTLISLGTAFFSNFDPVLPLGLEAQHVAGVLGIVLPAVTAYVVLRSPERLWILEIATRNRLADLKAKIMFEYDRSQTLASAELEQEYLSIMHDANVGWVQAKEGEGG